MGDDLSQRLGTRIRTLRKRAGLTQAALAEKAGLAVDAVARIERGTRDPRLRSLSRLAKGLGCSLPEVVDLDDDFLSRSPLPAGLASVVAPLRDQDRAVVETAARLTQALVVGGRSKNAS